MASESSDAGSLPTINARPTRLSRAPSAQPNRNEQPTARSLIHVVTVTDLSGPTMVSAVMRYDAITVIEKKEQHLRVPASHG
jgi:hypothetical protein